jgi:hypothetical protein
MKKDKLVITKDLASAMSFRRTLTNIERQRAYAIKLTSDCGISMHLDCYGIDYLPQVQEFYDKVLTVSKTFFV